LIVHDTGTGKTRTAIELALKNKGGCLVVMPKALKEQWWRNVTEHPDHKKILWELRTKEEFRKDYDRIKPYTTVIVDEAHYFSGMKSTMSKNLYHYFKKHNIQNRYLLTATPYLSTPWNIFVLARHLGYEWNYLDFKQKFFDEAWIGRRIIPVIKDGIQSEIAALVKKIGDVVRLDECIDVPDQIFETEFFKETPLQSKEKDNIEETNPVVRFTKHHEIENGFLMGNGYAEERKIGTYKNDRLYELAEQEKKIAIVCRYNSQIDMIYKHLMPLGKQIFLIRGETKQRDYLTQQIEKSSEAIVLINASCSEGYELPSIGLIAFASLSFSYKDYKQVCGRFLRINAPKKNVYVHLVTAEGVDEAVYEAIKNKQSFDINIYSRQMVY